MQELESLKFTNKFAELPEDFFHKQSWTPFDNPRLVHFNKDLAEILGLPKDLDPQNLVPYVNGNKPFKQSAPLSMAYAGHQFGSRTKLMSSISHRQRRTLFERLITIYVWH